MSITTTPTFTPAKRGYLVLIPFRTSGGFEYNEDCTIKSLPPRKLFAFAKVTSITKDGHIKRAERHYGWPRLFGIIPGERCYICDPVTLAPKSADDILEILKDQDFETTNQAVDTILKIIKQEESNG